VSIEPIITAFDPMYLASFVQQAKNRGILRSGILEESERAHWKALSQLIRKSKQISENDIKDFTIHLRILADHYLVFAIGERNYPTYVEQCKDVSESLDVAITAAKQLRKAIISTNVKAALEKPQGKAYNLNALDAALKQAIQAIEDARDSWRIPAPSRNPVRRANHALVQAFKELWECYSGKSIEGDSGAYKIANKYFACAGYMPRKGKGGEFANMSQLFAQAKANTKHLGPLVPVRRLTPEEAAIFAPLAF
jgi:hypothetical protein